MQNANVTQKKPVSVRALAESAIFADFMLVLMFVQHVLSAYAVIMPMFAPVAVAVMVRRNGARTSGSMILASILLTLIFVSPITATTTCFYCLAGLILGLARPNVRSQTLALIGAWITNFVGSFNLILIGTVLAGENIFDFRKVVLDNWIPGRILGGPFVIYLFLGFNALLCLGLAFGARWLTRKLLARM